VVGLQIHLEMPEEPLVLNENWFFMHTGSFRNCSRMPENMRRKVMLASPFKKTPTELILNYNDNGPGFDSSLIEKKEWG